MATSSTSSHLNMTLNCGSSVSMAVDDAQVAPEIDNSQHPSTDDNQLQFDTQPQTSSESLSPSFPAMPVDSPNDADLLTQSKDVEIPVPSLVQTSNSPLTSSSKPTKIKHSSVKSTSNSSGSGSSKSYSPSPNFPQMVFSFLPLSSAVETTLKATNFAATAFSKALSTSSTTVNSISLESSTSSSDQLNLQTPSGPSQSAPTTSALSKPISTLSSTSTTSSSALPYVHLPGVLTALDQAVQEYDVLLSENGAVAFMRPHFAAKVLNTGELEQQDLLDLSLDDTRLVEVKVLTREALISLATSAPLGYLALMEALKVGSPVPMKHLKASSLARLLNSVEAIFTKASDLVEANTTSSTDLGVETKNLKKEIDVTEVENTNDADVVPSGEKPNSFSPSTAVISPADDALISLLSEQSGLTTSLGDADNHEVPDNNNKDNDSENGGDKQDQDQSVIKREEETTTSQFDQNNITTSPNSTDSSDINTATSTVITSETDNDKTEEVVNTENDDENGIEETRKLSVPEVVLQPPTPQLPPSPPQQIAAPRRDSFLHGPRSKRYAHLTGIELLSMPAREKSASTPSLMSIACSEASNGASSNSNRNSIKSSSSSLSSAAEKLDTKAPAIMLPGDDFEDLKVDTEESEVDDELFRKSTPSAAKGSDNEVSDQTSIESCSERGGSSSGPSSLNTEGELKSSTQPSTSTTANLATASTSSGGGHKRRPSTLIQIHNPSYKARCEDFEAIFAEQGIPRTEQLMADFSCAYYKSILIQGRVYITQHFFAFYANWVGLYEKYMIIKCSDVRSIVKANTMMWIPNAIHITTVDGEKHIFASFGARDRAFEVMSTVWKAVKEADTETEQLMKKQRGDELLTVQSVEEEELVMAKTEEKPVDNGENAEFQNSENLSTNITNNSITSISSASTTLKAVGSFSNLSDEKKYSIVKSMYGNKLGFSQQEEIELFNLKKKETVELTAESTGSKSITKFTIGEQQQLTESGTGSSEEDKANGKENSKEVVVKQSSITVSTSLSTSTSSANLPKTNYSKQERSPHKNTSKNSSHQRKKSLSTLINFTTPATKSTKQASSSSKSTTSAIPVKCPCTDAHYGSIVIEKTYPVPVDAFYELFFAEATPDVPQSALFVDQFLRSRGTTDLQMTKWETLGTETELAELAKTCKDLGTYADVKATFGASASSTTTESSPKSECLNQVIKHRRMEFTVQLNHVMCKSCYTRERQYLLAAKPGAYYVVLSEAKNEGPPFSDCFVVCSTMCMSSAAGEGQTRVILQYKLCWIKTSLSMRMLTGTIERSSKEGFTEVALAKMKRAEMQLRLLPPDEHFLSSLPADVAASFSVSSQTSSADVSRTVVLQNGLKTNNASTENVPLSSSLSISRPNSLIHNNNQITSETTSANNSITLTPNSATLSTTDQPKLQTSCNNSAHSLLQNVNILLAVLVLFGIAYIVLINRVWAMEERMDKMTDFIMAVLKENGGNNGGDSDGSGWGSESA